MEVLGTFLSYVKRYFQHHKWNDFLLSNQRTRVLMFPEMPVLERPKIRAYQRHLFKISFRYGNFRHVSQLRQEVFPTVAVKPFFI